MARRGMMDWAGSGLPGLAASPMAEAAALAGAGFAVAQSLGPGQLAARYLAGRRDLCEVLPHLQVVHAVKPPIGRT